MSQLKTLSEEILPELKNTNRGVKEDKDMVRRLFLQEKSLIQSQCWRWSRVFSGMGCGDTRQ